VQVDEMMKMAFSCVHTQLFTLGCTSKTSNSTANSDWKVWKLHARDFEHLIMNTFNNIKQNCADDISAA
jgi:hypothetical protein